MKSENYPYLATPALGITVTTGSCNRNNPGTFRQAEKQPQHDKLTTLLFTNPDLNIGQCIIC